MPKQKYGRNPAQAYYEGVAAGKKQGVTNGFLAAMYLVLLGMYNTNGENIYLSDEAFTKFFTETEKETQRIFTEEYENDPENVAAVAIHHTNELRKKMGVETLC